jgi:hypothetical protein
VRARAARDAPAHEPLALEDLVSGPARGPDSRNTR